MKEDFDLTCSTVVVDPADQEVQEPVLLTGVEPAPDQVELGQDRSLYGFLLEDDLQPFDLTRDLFDPELLFRDLLLELSDASENPLGGSKTTLSSTPDEFCNRAPMVDDRRRTSVEVRDKCRGRIDS